MISSSTVSNVAHSSWLKPIALPVWLATSSCCKRYSLTSYGLGMKSVYRRTTNQINSQNDQVYAPVDNKKRYISPSRLACRLLCPLPCHKWVWLNWYLSTLGWRWTASITAMSCCFSRCFQQSNMSQNVVYSQSNMLHMAKLVIFLCSSISIFQFNCIVKLAWHNAANGQSIKRTNRYTNSAQQSTIGYTKLSWGNIHLACTCPHSTVKRKDNA